MSSHPRIILLGERGQALKHFHNFYGCSSGAFNWMVYGDSAAAATAFGRRVPDLVVFWGPLGSLHEEFARSLSIRQLSSSVVSLFRLPSGNAALPGWSNGFAVRQVLKDPHGINDLYQCIQSVLNQARLAKKMARVHRRHLESGSLSSRSLAEVIESYRGHPRQILIWMQSSFGMARIVLDREGVRHAQIGNLDGDAALRMLMTISHGNYDIQEDSESIYPHSVVLSQSAGIRSKVPAITHPAQVAAHPLEAA